MKGDDISMLAGTMRYWWDNNIVQEEGCIMIQRTASLHAYELIIDGIVFVLCRRTPVTQNTIKALINLSVSECLAIVVSLNGALEYCETLETTNDIIKLLANLACGQWPIGYMINHNTLSRISIVEGNGSMTLVANMSIHPSTHEALRVHMKSVCSLIDTSERERVIRTLSCVITSYREWFPLVANSLLNDDSVELLTIASYYGIQFSTDTVVFMSNSRIFMHNHRLDSTDNT